MKNLIAIVLILCGAALTINAEPICLVPTKSSVTPPVRMEPAVLTEAQAAKLLDAIAATKLIEMPEGFTLADLRVVYLTPVPTGLKLSIITAGH